VKSKDASAPPLRVLIVKIIVYSVLNLKYEELLPNGNNPSDKNQPITLYTFVSLEFVMYPTQGKCNIHPKSLQIYSFCDTRPFQHKALALSNA
jgi:hypothetical protein